MNPYVVASIHAGRTEFPWNQMNEDMQAKILGYACRSVVLKREDERKLPDELRPPDMPDDRGHPCPGTIQTFRFERTIDIKLADGPLTVTFSDCVNRTWWGFTSYAEAGWPLDPDAVCKAMDFKQTWTGVRRIRMPVITLDYQRFWYFEFVRQGEDGRDEVLSASHVFKIYSLAQKRSFTSRFIEELNLKHAFVDGVHEYSV